MGNWLTETMTENTKNPLRNLSFQVGNALEICLHFVGDTLRLTLEAIGFIAERRLRVKLLVRQMSTIGADSLLLCVLILFFSGMVLGLNVSSGMVKFGAASYVGGLVIISLTRELAPTLVGVLVAARAGSAMAAEIGSMAVSEQIDALRALAVSPVRYLVVPRVTASFIMMPLLTIIAEVFGALGAYLVSLQSGVSANQFIHSATVFLTQRDLLGGLLKTMVFGVIIAVISCRQGLRTQGGAVGVGKATTSAVVISIVLILVANYFLSTVLVEPIKGLK
jgi:phospholipid/cholesterol/gamma-HCH transport system permease protein